MEIEILVQILSPESSSQSSPLSSPQSRFQVLYCPLQVGGIYLLD